MNLIEQLNKKELSELLSKCWLNGLGINYELMPKIKNAYPQTKGSVPAALN